MILVPDAHATKMIVGAALTILRLINQCRGSGKYWPVSLWFPVQPNYKFLFN